MRKRARRSELTWGYSLPPWLEDAGLKSSTAGADSAGAVWGCVACANAIWPASRGSNTKPIDAALITGLLGPETRSGQRTQDDGVAVPLRRVPSRCSLQMAARNGSNPVTPGAATGRGAAG